MNKDQIISEIQNYNQRMTHYVNELTKEIEKSEAQITSLQQELLYWKRKYEQLHNEARSEVVVLTSLSQLFEQPDEVIKKYVCTLPVVSLQLNDYLVLVEGVLNSSKFYLLPHIEQALLAKFNTGELFNQGNTEQLLKLLENFIFVDKSYLKYTLHLDKNSKITQDARGVGWFVFQWSPGDNIVVHPGFPVKLPRMRFHDTLVDQPIEIEVVIATDGFDKVSYSLPVRFEYEG